MSATGETSSRLIVQGPRSELRRKSVPSGSLAELSRATKSDGYVRDHPQQVLKKDEPLSASPSIGFAATAECRVREGVANLDQVTNDG